LNSFRRCRRKKEEFVKVVKNEILPILKEQSGLLEILPFLPETMTDKVLFFSIYGRKSNTSSVIKKSGSRKVEENVKPYLTTPMTCKLYKFETTICAHFEKAAATLRILQLLFPAWLGAVRSAPGSGSRFIGTAVLNRVHKVLVISLALAFQGCACLLACLSGSNELVFAFL
jgi:hypothetical protein